MATTVVQGAPAQAAPSSPATPRPTAPESSRAPFKELPDKASASADADAQASAGETAPKVDTSHDQAAPAPLSEFSKAWADAKKTGKPVELASETTETVISYVQPDGMVEVQSSAGPARAKVDGHWVDVDTTLEFTAHGVRPKVVTGEITFSDGGTEPMAVLGDGEASSITLGWTGRLPKPVLKGDTATYRNVLPNVDLVLRATRVGFEQHLVVKRRPDTATRTALGKLRFPMTTQGARVTKGSDGQLQVLDEAGETIGNAAPPIMWDARTDARTDQPVAVQPIGLDLDGGPAAGEDGTLVLAPPTDFLTDPATVYPVIIDPTQALGALGDTFVQNNIANTPYGGSTELRTGTYGGGAVARSFLKFDVRAVANRVVQSANLAMFEFHSWSCGARWVDIRPAGDFDPNTVTWNSQPWINWGQILGNANVAFGYSSACPANWVNFNLTSGMQWWSDSRNNAGNVMPLAITAGSESDVYAWKKFNSGNAGGNVPTLTFTYDGNCDQYAGNRVCGGIRDKWWSIGGPSSYLGLPTNSETPTPNKYGYFSHFQGNGSIYWSPNTGAHVVRNGIRDKWASLGWENGRLGFPTTDEVGLQGGTGAYTHFEGGSVYWSVNTDSHAIFGGIRDKWFQLGAENSPVGYPTTDEVGIPGGAYTRFERGSVSWSPETQAHMVWGGIHGLWAQMGYETSFLGFPTSDEYSVRSGRRSDFQRGQISWDAQSGVTDWGAGPMSDAGLPSWATALGYQIADSVNVSVNVGTGNLNVAVAGLTVPGVEGDHEVGLTYNSLAGAVGSTDPATSTLGKGFRLTDSAGLRLITYPDGSVRFIDPSGRAYLYAWNATTKVYDPQTGDKSTSLTRDAANNWVLTALTSDRKLTFRAGDGLLLSDADRNGNAFTYAYDAAGQPTSVTGTRAGGAPVTFTIGGNGIPAGHVGSISQTVGSAIRAVTLGYDAATDTLTSVTDPLGRKTAFTWTGSDVTGITAPSGTTTAFAYDTGHRVTQVVQDAAAGGFNATARLEYTTTVVNGTTFGAVKVTDPRGNATTYTVDVFGKVTAATDALGRSRSASYNVNSSIVKITGATAANTTTLAYNAAAAYQPTSTTSPTGAKTTLDYPTSGTGPLRYLPIASTDAEGNVTTLGYDARGNVTSAAVGGVTVTASYNPPAGSAPACGGLPGQLCSSNDGNGRTTSYRYDSTGNLVAMTPPAAGALKATSATYDGAGRQTTDTDGTGVATGYAYDSLDRLTEIRYGGAVDCSDPAKCMTLAYDSSGNVRTRRDGGGTTTYTYDALSRLVNQTVETATGATATSMTYDLAGNLITYTDGNGTVTYTYDAADQLVGLAEPGGSCTGTVVACTTYAYDANGVRTQVAYPGGTKVQYLSVDASGRALEYKATGPSGTVIMDFLYSFTTSAGKDSGLMQSRKDSTVAGVAVQTYTYDARNQLTRALESVGGTASAGWAYCYDGAGNRTFDSAGSAPTTTCPGQSGGPAATYSYDPTNALVGRSGQLAGAYAYDGNGAETAGAGVAARSAENWNAAGQLTGVTAGGVSHTYGYTGPGNKERTTADGSAFANSPLGVMAEAGSYSLVREPGGALVALRQGGQSYYFVTDRQGSTIALVDGTGVVRNSYSYDPYGISRAKTENVVNPWQYIGGYLDSTGMYHFDARYYDPVLGRFTQLDPSGRDPHYLYANNNPVNMSDPSGLDASGWAYYGCQQSSAGARQQCFNAVNSRVPGPPANGARANDYRPPGFSSIKIPPPAIVIPPKTVCNAAGWVMWFIPATAVARAWFMGAKAWKIAQAVRALKASRSAATVATAASGAANLC